jgi:hypothetical protein
VEGDVTTAAAFVERKASCEPLWPRHVRGGLQKPSGQIVVQHRLEIRLDYHDRSYVQVQNLAFEIIGLESELFIVNRELPLVGEEFKQVVDKLLDGMKELDASEVPPFIYQMLRLCGNQYFLLVLMHAQKYFKKSAAHTGANTDADSIETVFTDGNFYRKHLIFEQNPSYFLRQLCRPSPVGEHGLVPHPEVRRPRATEQQKSCILSHPTCILSRNFVRQFDIPRVVYSDDL